MKNPFYSFYIEMSSNTSLKSFDEIYYKCNVDYYRKFKKILMFFSIVLAIVCIAVIIISNGWVQSLFATLLGGTLSSIVWFISVIITDEMNYRINQIDDTILQIDRLVSELHMLNQYFIKGMKVIPIDFNNLLYRLCNLLQVINDLSIIETIDNNGLKFKWIDGPYINIDEFKKSSMEILNHSHILLKEYTVEQLNDFIIYNEKCLDREFNELKKVLLKRKGYILCGKAPIPQDKVQDRLIKAKLFDKIFNRNQKETE